jgi:hypothetical protein
MISLKRLKSCKKKSSRSLRLNSPANFEADKIVVNPNGKNKEAWKSEKGLLKVVAIKALQSLKDETSELQRTMVSETRKRSHGELANTILSIGKHIKTERLSYKGFQKNFGRSVGKHAPGLLMEILRHKAENCGGVYFLLEEMFVESYSSGGELIEFNTRTTALNQSCQCGNRHKKSLRIVGTTASSVKYAHNEICTVLFWPVLFKKTSWIDYRHKMPGNGCRHTPRTSAIQLKETPRLAKLVLLPLVLARVRVVYLLKMNRPLLVRPWML